MRQANPNNPGSSSNIEVFQVSSAEAAILNALAA